jgi:hypothetical protein
MQEFISRTELLKLLFNRVNHLEDLLVGNLLGFIVTATFAGFAGAYTLRSDSVGTLSLKPRQVFHGISLLYVLLSGYYYFMLGQFYSVLLGILKLTENQADLPWRLLWQTLRFPSFGFLPDNLTNFLMLINAPLFPLMVSVIVLFGFWLLIRNPQRTSKTLTAKDIWVAISIQMLLCLLMTWSPFTTFLQSLPKI